MSSKKEAKNDALNSAKMECGLDLKAKQCLHALHALTRAKSTTSSLFPSPALAMKLQAILTQLVNDYRPRKQRNSRERTLSSPPHQPTRSLTTRLRLRLEMAVGRHLQTPTPVAWCNITSSMPLWAAKHCKMCRNVSSSPISASFRCTTLIVWYANCTGIKWRNLPQRSLHMPTTMLILAIRRASYRGSTMRTKMHSKLSRKKRKFALEPVLTTKT